MDSVSIRELRNHGGVVVDRAEAGESFVVTRDGKPVAEIRPIRPAALDAATLLARWRHLPRVDVDGLRSDIDAILDPSV